jgi:hypothetical protein
VDGYVLEASGKKVEENKNSSLWYSLTHTELKGNGTKSVSKKKYAETEYT